MLPDFLKQRPVYTSDGLRSALCHGIVYLIFTEALVGVTATVPGGRTHRHTYRGICRTRSGSGLAELTLQGFLNG